MTKTGARSLLAAIPLALMLALTGCGSDGGGSDDDVASAESSTPDSDAGESTPDGDGGESNEPLSEDDRYEQMLDWAQCLRDNGLDVDDPAPGEGIQLQIEGDPAQADAAMKACEDKEPPPPADAPDEGEEREDMLAYAKCMRDNGVEAFADPKAGEGINIGPEVFEDPDFEKAEETCDEATDFGGDRQESTQGSDA